uniref:CRAL_TRIO_N domain-containing protein n=1 Tax=Glossina pallidipes TaxID=7398 RepID=A0A1A9ZAN2_GLOPL
MEIVMVALKTVNAIVADTAVFPFSSTVFNILTNPDLCASIDDQYLIAFLRGCKYSLEKVKKKIDSYCTYKTRLYFSSSYPRNSYPVIYSVEEVLAVNHVLQDILMLEDGYAVVNGLLTIADLEGLTLSHVLQMTAVFLKKWITYIIHVYII